MKAFVMTRYGAPDVATWLDQPKAEPGAHQLRIRVRAVGLNPVDYKIREGQLKVLFRYPMPAILGNELSGEVDAMGSEVRGFRMGERVHARVAKESMGAFAEFALIDAHLCAPLPDALTHAQGAALPLAGLTALQVLRDELHVKPGMRLLISGGAGGVGCFAIPLAKHFGAHVTTTASAKGMDLVKRLGADEVIDYTAVDLADGSRDFDGGFDLVGGDTALKMLPRLRAGSRLVSIAATPEPRTAALDLHRGVLFQSLFWLISWRLRRAAKSHRIDYRYFFMRPDGNDLRYLDQLVVQNQMPITIDRVFAQDQMMDAFKYLESGRAKGKIVVRL